MNNKETSSDTPKSDFLRIIRIDDVGSVKCAASTITFVNPDTSHFVVYVSSLELYGYGTNMNEAKEMLPFTIKEFFNYLILLSTKKLQNELICLGWTKNKYKHKDFSSSFVDNKSSLKNFNLDDKNVIKF